MEKKGLNINKIKKLKLLQEEPALAIFDELENIQENLEPIKISLFPHFRRLFTR